MKNILVAIVAFFALLFLYTRFAGPLEFSINSITTNKTDNFTVTGTGKVEVKPDLAVLNAGVTSQGATIKATQDVLNKAINNVNDAVKKQGVDPKDIQTSNYSLNPIYDYRSGQKITGYQGNANLTIKIRNLDKAGNIIEAATNAGANQLGGLTFEIADKTKAENEAREKAVAQAKQTAENAARIAGFRLGRVVNYSENFGGNPPQIFARTLDAKVEPAEPPQIEPGTNEVTVMVSLSYEIR